MKKISLWIVRYPEVEKGWIYLSKEKAEADLKAAAPKLLKNINIDIKMDKFIIEPYRIMDHELNDILRESLPELFL